MSLIPLDRHAMTGLILAGGRGTRMGGVDKGLQVWVGQPLVWHALQRIKPQVGSVIMNANRHVEEYQRLGVPVYPDALADFPGPLAGFAVGLQEAQTPYLLTVPCDSPRFPLDLASRLAQALQAHSADIAMVSAPETAEDGKVALRSQPVFCLLSTRLKASLFDFLASGQRKIDRWTSLHRTVLVPFDLAQDDPHAFANINTLAELNSLPFPP
jgi:molybdopterin-guanine dinucleotide biosynthesis protein A